MGGKKEELKKRVRLCLYLLLLRYRVLDLELLQDLVHARETSLVLAFAARNCWAVTFFLPTVASVRKTPEEIKRRRI